MTPIQFLADFVTATPTAAIPDATLAVARLTVVDTVGCALAGLDEPAARISADWVSKTAGVDGVTLWGRMQRARAADAAFANGIASHALDFDDSLPALRGHPSATLVPTALAVGESVDASGREVLAALALGLEVLGTLGQAVGNGHYLRGWHTTATVGAMGATAVAARLYGLSAEQLAIAWGLAASQVSGLVGNFGTMTKPFHAGHAARTGVESAELAKLGFTASANIFEGKENFFRTYGGEDGKPLADMLQRLGRTWYGQDPGIYVKRWPCCYCSHRAIGGVMQLVAEHCLTADDVESVEVGFLPGSDNALISEDPKSGLEGKFSIEYAMAALLLDGDLNVASFTDEQVNRPAVRALMKKVRRYRIEAPGVYSGIVGFTDVTLGTRLGRFTRRIEITPGSPQWPMTKLDQEAKFDSNARGALGEARARALRDCLLGLEQQGSMRNAMALAASN